MLVEQGKSEINTKNNKSETPLFFLCIKREPPNEIIEYLLSKNADINAKNENGDTCINVACKYKENNLYLIKLLLKKNANPSIENNEKKNCLQTLCSLESPQLLVIKYIVENSFINLNLKSEGLSLVSLLSQNADQNMDIIRYLIKKGLRDQEVFSINFPLKIKTGEVLKIFNYIGFYKGELENNQPHGRGSMIYLKKNSNKLITWKGEWSKSKMITGIGKCIWIDENKDAYKFEGYLKNGLPNGMVHLKNMNTGVVFKGKMVDGKKFGKGILIHGSNEFFVNYDEKQQETKRERTFNGVRFMIGKYKLFL